MNIRATAGATGDGPFNTRRGPSDDRLEAHAGSRNAQLTQLLFAVINAGRLRREKEGFLDHCADTVIIADLLDEFSVRREIDFESVE